MNESTEPAYVIDTSVVVKWFIPEAFTDDARRYLDAVIDRHAPDYLKLEARSALLKRCRRRPGEPGRLTVEEARVVAASIESLPFRYHPTTLLTDNAFDLALEIGSSFYDGLFLALALQTTAKLVTADRKFYDKLAASDYASMSVWVCREP